MSDTAWVVHLVDLALALTALEGVLILGRRRRRPVPAGWLWHLASGACLMLALRTSLAGAPWPAWAALLGLSGLAHLGAMREQWRGTDAA